MRTTFDLIILGSGAGGSTLAYSLRQTGLKILVVERGDFVPKESQNWDPAAVFGQSRYQTSELWRNAHSGWRIRPTEYYHVGGKTKFFGAAFLRLRERDFQAVEHREGLSPEWPVSYSELEPYYTRAEKLYGVHGLAGADPTEPFRSEPYPFPALPHGEYIQQLTARLRDQGVRPFPIPMGLDYRDGGRCVYCRTCDGYPCHVDGKSDAEVCCLRPALESGNVELLTNAFAQRLIVGADGQIDAVEVKYEQVCSLSRAEQCRRPRCCCDRSATHIRMDWRIPRSSSVPI
jgi:choline dehydrogenase-like flavoprotein